MKDEEILSPVSNDIAILDNKKKDDNTNTANDQEMNEEHDIRMSINDTNNGETNVESKEDQDNKHVSKLSENGTQDTPKSFPNSRSENDTKNDNVCCKKKTFTKS